MEEEIPKRRLNGFERPFHPLQVLAWGVFGADVIVFAVFCLPLIEIAGARIGVSVAYAASVVTLVTACARATACDPVDPNVVLPPSSSEEVDSMPFCPMCNVPVLARSKHCRACSKCVDVFDHHCMWLNNCIGAANYRSFFVTVSSVAVMIGIILGVCLYLLVDIFTEAGDFEGRVLDLAHLAPLPRGFFLALMILMVVVNGPLFLLDCQLVLLHLFLMSQHLTTYEYIMNKRSQMEDEEQRVSGDSTATKLRKRIRTLPHWMDWIVFSRCGRRKRRKEEKTAVERIGSPEDTDPEGEKEEQAAAGGVFYTAPPGSTSEAGLEERHTQASGAGTSGAGAHLKMEAQGRTLAPVAAHGAAVAAAAATLGSCEVPAMGSPPADVPKVPVADKSGCGCDAAPKQQQQQQQQERPSSAAKL